MRRLLKIYAAAVSNNIKARMSYRVDFIFSLIITICGEMLLPLFTVLIYQTGAVFKGWNFYEALLIQAIFLMSLGVAYSLFFGIIWVTMGNVREGTFDIILLKPVSPIVTGIAFSFDLDNLGVILSGLVFFIYSLMHMPVPGMLSWVQFVFLFIMGIIVLLAFSLFMAGIMFKWVGNSRIHEMFTSVSTFGRYPIALYPKVINAIISFVIPIAMIGFFPAQALLGRLGIEACFSAVICLVFLVLAYLFWKRMVYTYSSAGG